jgi:hypothetical protein
VDEVSFPNVPARKQITNDSPGYVDPESEGGLEDDLRNRRYPALLNDDYDSDEY